MKPEAYSLLDFAASHLTKLSDDDREQKIMIETQNQARASDAPLRTIVANLAEFAFRNFRLLPSEFTAIFQQQREATSRDDTSITQDLSDILVAGFTENFRAHMMTSNNVILPVDDDEFIQKRARDRLIDFLEHYHSAKLTLSEFLSSQQHFFPSALFFDLFSQDEEVRQLLTSKIRDAAPDVILEKYKTLYRENPHDFALSFLLKRVITYRDGKFITVNKKNLKALVDYLAKQQDPPYQLENLYFLLFTYLTEMRKILNIEESVRADIEGITPGLLVQPTTDDQGGLLHTEFDFHAFFRDYFKTPIQETRNATLKEKPRSVDLQAYGMDYIIAPDRSMQPFTEMALLTLEPDLFNAKIRSFFGYTATEDEDGLSDAQVEATLSRQLSFAANQIKYTLKHGLKMRPKDDPIHEDFTFLSPILACREPKQLVKWFVYPGTFAEDFPECAKTTPTIVRFQARRLLEYLILYREHAFNAEFKHRSEKRDSLEKHLRNRLNIHDDTVVDLSFRILMEVDLETQEAIKNSSGAFHYEVSFPENPEWPKGCNEGEEVIIEKDGKYYKALPAEQKKFLKVKMDIPTTYGSLRPIEVLFYTEDEHILTVKSLQSYLSSFVRGKIPSDLVRCTMVIQPSTSKEDVEALIDVIYEYSTHAVKIDHGTEGRNISKKKSGEKRKSRSSGSSAFESQRVMSNAAYAVLPKTPSAVMDSDCLSDEELEQLDADQHSKIGFETQVLDLVSQCIAASDHTTTSHHMSYAPEREFTTACLNLFHPIVYGQKYAKYYLEGYKGDQEV